MLVLTVLVVLSIAGIGVVVWLLKSEGEGSDDSSTGEGINLSEAGKRIDIGSKRRQQQIVDELEQAGLIKTYRLREKDQPRIIEPIQSWGGLNSGPNPD